MGAALAHLAFWDQRAAVLMKIWSKERVAPSPVDTEVTNDALLPLCLAILPRAAAELAISSAETIDREIAKASPALLSEIEELGDRFRLWRSEHRRSHIDQIEDALRAHPRHSAAGSVTESSSER